jgi:phospholipase/carboxylesterase
VGITRRTTATLVSAAVVVVAGCSDPVELGNPDSRAQTRGAKTTTTAPGAGYGRGRLSARPRRAPARAGARTGTFEIGIARTRDSLLHVPRSYDPKRPAPFALTLHGAGSYAANGLRRLLPFADSRGMILLAVSSRERSWDVLYGGFGPDVEMIDRSLELVFERYSIDPDHVATQGFSDGASYALSLGLTNGDLFTHVIALSAGFMSPGAPVGSPPIFVSHGRDDPILPIDGTSRIFVPKLEEAGYEVTYRVFEGGHVAPRSIVAQSVKWFLGEDSG